MSTPSSPAMTGTPATPAWVDTVRRRYLSGDASVFVLYRNIYDRILLDGKFVELEQYLFRSLLEGKKKRVLSHSIASGTQALAGRAFDAEAEPLDGIEAALMHESGTAVVIHYAGSLFPAGDPSMMTMQDRQAIAKLHRWSLNPQIGDSDNVVFLLVESLAELSAQILSNPRIATVEIPMPGQAERETTIRMADSSLDAGQVTRLAQQASGLRLVQLFGLLGNDANAQAPNDAEREALIKELIAGTEDAEARAKQLTKLTSGQTNEQIRHLLQPGSKAPAKGNAFEEIAALLRTRKRELVTQECFGLIEFVEPKFGLEGVGGMTMVKAELAAIAAAIRSGNVARIPMGILVVGPMGSGKTFVTKAFVREAGIPAVMLKNIRSKWVGATESNLEKVLAMVKAMGPIALIIDEGDRSLGGEGDEDGGTSSRVTARLKEFMSDTDNRGQVLFIMMTNRPDKLDADMKRPGRFDTKIPLFFPENGAERANIVRVILKRFGKAIEEPPQDDDEDDGAGAGWMEAALEDTEFSNAELEALTLLSIDLAERADGRLTREVFLQAAVDYMPTRDTLMIEYMELLAISEASRRSLLPEKFKHRTTDELHAEMKRVRSQLRL
ncbi:ATP-binding protein [Acidovorax sp. Root217]|uniref:ATP-binding protein n=1 Tax=Acidovorax sp. Root217 TaxID=1736492 RepID=UPI0012F8384E|nr:AAA family ATPase [Acidovorax sp. Root217]